MSQTHLCPKCSTPVPADSRFCQTCGAGVSPKGAPAKKSPPANKGAGSQWKMFVGGLLVVVLLVAGAIMAMGQGGSKAPVAKVPGTIAGAGAVPQWLATADPSIIADYEWAAEHHDELSVMPCYCGCNSVGHTNNAACYFRWDNSGKILGYDAHALG
jgi:hypothetical protein